MDFFTKENTLFLNYDVILILYYETGPSDVYDIDTALNEEDGTTERTRDKESTCSRLERTCTYYTDFRGRDAVSLSLLDRKDEETKGGHCSRGRTCTYHTDLRGRDAVSLLVS